MKNLEKLLTVKMPPELQKAWNSYLMENKKIYLNKPIKSLIRCVALWLYQQNGSTDIYDAQDKALEFMVRNNI